MALSKRTGCPAKSYFNMAAIAPENHGYRTSNTHTDTDLATRALLAMGQKRGINLANKSRLRSLASKAKNKVEEIHADDPEYGKAVEVIEEGVDESSEEGSREGSIYSMSDSDEEVSVCSCAPRLQGRILSIFIAFCILLFAFRRRTRKTIQKKKPPRRRRRT